MTAIAPFQGYPGQNQVVSVTTTPTIIFISPKAKSVRIVNLENNGFRAVHVRIEEPGATTVDSTDMPVRSIDEIVVQKSVGQTQVTIATLVDTATVYVQPGEGGY